MLVSFLSQIKLIKSWMKIVFLMVPVFFSQSPSAPNLNKNINTFYFRRSFFVVYFMFDTMNKMLYHIMIKSLCLAIICIGKGIDEDDFRKVFDDLSSVETLSSFIHLLQLYKVSFHQFVISVLC